MKTKILFLDVDGVLCTLRSHLARNGMGGTMDAWDREGVDIIKRCCEMGVLLVISSTWRLNCHLPDVDSSPLAVKLREYDIVKYLYGDWKTPCKWSAERGVEVGEWLRKHPEVDDYKILDDDSDFFDDQKPHLIQTDFQNGISGEQMIELLEWAEE